MVMLLSLGLCGYLVWQSVRSPAGYRELQRRLAAGDPRARLSCYRRSLSFEVVSVAWACLAMALDRAPFRPAALDLGRAPLLEGFGRFVHGSGRVTFGVAFAAVLIVGTIAQRRQRPSAAPRRPGLLPNLRPLIPETRRERWLFALVALGAGVGEEIVFRGWLLGFLHQHLGLGGPHLLVAAAAVFGLAHLYQGALGVLLTGYTGAIFCALYVGTGSLLFPMILHTAIDLRFAFVARPVPRGSDALCARPRAPAS